jgi:hypothetical protein
LRAFSRPAKRSHAPQPKAAPGIPVPVLGRYDCGYGRASWVDFFEEVVLMFGENQKIVSVTLTDHGELEVVRQYKSNTAYCSGSPCPDRVVKEIYRADEGGMIRLFETKEGKHTPAYMVRERIEF